MNTYKVYLTKKESFFYKKFLFIIMVIFSIFTYDNLLAKSTIERPIISINVKDKSIKDILYIIEEQSDYRFIYESGKIDLGKKISLNENSKDIESILNKLFNENNIKYEITDNNLILVNPTSYNNNQEIKSNIKGTVIDSKGQPIAGAYIYEKGSNNGTTTNVDGSFELSNIKKKTIIVSTIGYLDKEISFSNENNLKIILSEDTQSIDEVIIVGYGSQKKVNLTGSVASISSKSIANRSISNISQGLQGLVPGMTITSSGGQPGLEDGKIRIRGVGSFNSSSPMVLIDGIEGDMNIIDAQDIESVSVLKDAASASIYGSKAANGVILITTKRGKKNTPTVNYSALFGWSKPADLMPRTSSEELAILTNEAEYWNAISEGASIEQAKKRMPYSDKDIELYKNGTDPYGHPNTDWNGLFYVGSGFINRHNLSVNGGSEWVRYHTSIGYNKQDGIVKNASNRQANIRVNLDMKISEKINSKVNINYTNTYIQEPTNPVSWHGGGNFFTYRQANRISPMVPYKNEDGSYGTISDGNPIAFQDLGASGKRKNDYITVFAETAYKIVDGLEAKINGSYSSTNQDYTLYRPDIQYNSAKYDGPIRLTQAYYTNKRSQSDMLITYDKTFREKHTINFLAGFHTELYQYKETSAFRKDFPSTDVTDLNGGSIVGMTNGGYTRELAMNSLFSRLKYNYDNRYLFEANVRGDASSRFAKDYRWGWFPSFSGAWRINNEEFLKDIDYISDLKLRASWGVLGNQDIVGDYYPYINTYSTSPKYPFGNSIKTGAAQTNNKITDLSWETTYTWGIGLDLTLLNSLTMTIDWYNRKTTGILMVVNVPTTYGYPGYYDNIGKMNNKGIELALKYNKTFNEIEFNAGFNASYNKNKVLSLGEIDDQKSGRNIVKVGYPYQAFYGYQSDGLFQNEEEIKSAPKYSMIDNSRLIPGDIKLVDRNNDNIIDDKDKIIMNSEDPKYTFAINLGAKWRYFDISLFFQGAAGVARYFTDEMYGEFNGDSGHPSKLWLDRWTPENPTNKWPRASKFRTYNLPEVTTSDFWLVNTSYVRLKDIQFGISMPKSWLNKLKITNARIYYSGQNIFTLKKCPKGIDPEAPSGWGAYYPHIKTNSVGLSLTF